MESGTLALHAPSAALEAAFHRLLAAYEAAGEHLLSPAALALARQDFAGYVRLLEEEAAGIGLAPGLVPQNTYWLVRDQLEIVGTSRLRHFLTPTLEDNGGHIGYSICPTDRRRGYGTHILALTVARARARGLARVLVTCDADNIGSARIIQKNGGLLASESVSHTSGQLVSRYWIDLL